MLLLMDEVFDLKEKNQWLRRNIKNLLQQLIRATYGDTINRSERHRHNTVFQKNMTSNAQLVYLLLNNLLFVSIGKL